MKSAMHLVWCFRLLLPTGSDQALAQVCILSCFELYTLRSACHATAYDCYESDCAAGPMCTNMQDLQIRVILKGLGS